MNQKKKVKLRMETKLKGIANDQLLQNIPIHFQPYLSVASGTLVAERFQLWKGGAVSLKDLTDEEDIRFKNAVSLQKDEDIECLQYSTRDGVPHLDSPIERTEDTEDLRGAGMEREDLGQTLFTF